MRKYLFGLAILLLSLASVSCGKSSREREADAVRANEQRKAQELEARKREEVAAARVSADAARLVNDALIEKLRKYVTDVLKDPASAQFSDVRLNADKNALCGSVNAKNGFGGYDGFRPFVSTESGVIASIKAYIDSEEPLAHELYKSVAGGKGCI